MRLALVAAIAVLGAGSGCALDPFADESVPPLEELGVRVSEGLGAAARYLSSAEVAAGNTVQLRARIGDGKVIEVEVPRGPATEIAIEPTMEGAGEALDAVTLRSRTGQPFELERPYDFDPGFVAIEDRSNEERIALRIAAPRLTGTAQGQVLFTFKLDVVAPGGDPP